MKILKPISAPVDAVEQIYKITGISAFLSSVNLGIFLLGLFLNNFYIKKATYMGYILLKLLTELGIELCLQRYICVHCFNSFYPKTLAVDIVLSLTQHIFYVTILAMNFFLSFVLKTFSAAIKIIQLQGLPLSLAHRSPIS